MVVNHLSTVWLKLMACGRYSLVGIIVQHILIIGRKTTSWFMFKFWWLSIHGPKKDFENWKKRTGAYTLLCFNFAENCVQTDDPLWLSASRTGHICNEGIFARLIATKYMQWILVHISQTWCLNVIYRECKCISVTLVWPNLYITSRYKDQ